MAEKMNNNKQLVTFALLALLVGGVIGFLIAPDKKVEVPVIVEKVVTKEIPVYQTKDLNLTPIENKLNSISSELDKELKWREQALDLANAEWSRSKNKPIYLVISELYGDIVEKKDIRSVEVRNIDFLYLDEYDQDAIIVQEVKVRYENSEGDMRKVYLLITTHIKDGELESQEIEEA